MNTAGIQRTGSDGGSSRIDGAAAFQGFHPATQFGELGRDVRQFSLKLADARSRLLRRGLPRRRIDDVGAAPLAALDQPLFRELSVRVLHGHEGDAELAGVALGARQPRARAVHPVSNVVAERGSDLLGVGLLLRLRIHS